MKKHVIFLVFYLFSTSGSLVNASETIIKSSNDKNDYRFLELENGLQVILVSDSDADKSAASLDINIGSGSDPEDWQGLAHFLEHMLFLGTKKYPNAGEYQEFIKSHGGSHNAYTSFSHTNYYFSIGSEYFLPALDRFSRFFIDPTFDSDFVERERQVVHSEFQARRKDEGRRLWAANRELVNPDHPWSQFSVGSVETLRDRDTHTAREKLIAFYDQHYSANIMRLAIVGPDTLDVLEEWVVERFSEIQNTNAHKQHFEVELYDPSIKPARIDLVPEKEEMSVGFVFPIPSTYQLKRTKPAEYISNLLGHEGEGSLLALLKTLGWAESLSAGIGYMDETQGTLNISIGLTEAGRTEIEGIGKRLFQTIQLIKDSGVELWRFQEEQQLAEIAFQFREEGNVSRLAQSLAANLHEYDYINVLQGPYLRDRYDPEAIEQLLAYLTPDNLYLKVVDQSHITQDKTDYFDVEYALSPIDPQWVSAWASIEDEKLDARLQLPEPNPFIPSRLEVGNTETENIQPIQLITEKGLQGWYRPDTEFESPRSAFYMSFQSPVSSNSAKNQITTELWIRLVNEQLSKISYPAYLAGLNYSLYRHARGFSVKLSGYEDKQSELLRFILDAITSTPSDEELLSVLKAEVTRELLNASKDSPSDQVVHEIYRVLMEPYWTEEEQLEAVVEITMEDILVHQAQLLSQINVTLLAHGDISESRVVRMQNQVKKAFESSELIESVAKPRVRKLSDGQSFIRTLEIDHTDSGYAIYLQGGEASIRERAKTYLLGQIIESAFYHNLRTVNQVGYIVYATAFTIQEVPSLIMTVQSPSHQPGEINTLVNVFLKQFSTDLNAISADEFESIKQGLISIVMERDKNLGERTARYWREIDRKEFEFDTQQIMANTISKLELADIQAYYLKLIDSKTKGQLIVQSAGKNADARLFVNPEENGILLQNAYDIKNSELDYYSFK